MSAASICHTRTGQWTPTCVERTFSLRSASLIGLFDLATGSADTGVDEGCVRSAIMLSYKIRSLWKVVLIPTHQIRESMEDVQDSGALGKLEIG